MLGPDRTDSILLLFEKLVYNRIERNTKNTTLSNTKYGMYRDSTTEYSLNEKKFTMYPFFKKWMLRNNIDNLYNTDFDVVDYKTWNYRASNDLSPGYWRAYIPICLRHRHAIIRTLGHGWI